MIAMQTPDQQDPTKKVAPQIAPLPGMTPVNTAAPPTMLGAVQGIADQNTHKAPMTGAQDAAAPSVAPLPPPPPTPGTFNADSNLISSQITPTDSPRLSTLGNQQDAAVNNLTTGPNRTQLAMQSLKDFETASQPELEAGYRRVGQRAATLGRLGAGMTTNDLTGLRGQYDRNRLLLQNDLAKGVAEGDINDRFRTVDALSGLRGQENGIQTGNRNELRGERNYQYGLSQDAQDSAVRQKMLEDQLLNSAFGRSESRLNAGNAGNPAGLLGEFGNQASGEAGDLYGAAGQLFGNMGAKSGASSSSVSPTDLALQILRMRNGT